MKKGFDLEKSEQSEMSNKVYELIEIASKEGIKEAVPSIHLIADEGAGISSFAKHYATAIMKCNIFNQRCRKCYIELEFKPQMPEDKLKQFFQSINDAAVTSNRYYGTIVLYISKWRYRDMEETENFIELLKYLNRNRGNLRVIFVTGTQCTDIEKIYSLLKQYLNIYQVYLSYPDVDVMVRYVTSKLYMNGVVMDKESEGVIREWVMKIRDGKHFRGYHTLNTLIDGIKYYFCINNENGRIELRMEQLNEIVPDIDKDKMQKIGF